MDREEYIKHLEQEIEHLKALLSVEQQAHNILEEEIERLKKEKKELEEKYERLNNRTSSLQKKLLIYKNRIKIMEKEEKIQQDTEKDKNKEKEEEKEEEAKKDKEEKIEEEERKEDKLKEEIKSIIEEKIIEENEKLKSTISNIEKRISEIREMKSEKSEIISEIKTLLGKLEENLLRETISRKAKEEVIQKDDNKADSKEEDVTPQKVNIIIGKYVGSGNEGNDISELKSQVIKSLKDFFEKKKSKSEEKNKINLPSQDIKNTNKKNQSQKINNNEDDKSERKKLFKLNINVFVKKGKGIIGKTIDVNENKDNVKYGFTKTEESTEKNFYAEENERNNKTENVDLLSIPYISENNTNQATPYTGEKTTKDNPSKNPSQKSAPKEEAKKEEAKSYEKTDSNTPPPKQVPKSNENSPTTNIPKPKNEQGKTEENDTIESKREETKRKEESHKIPEKTEEEKKAKKEEREEEEREENENKEKESKEREENEGKEEKEEKKEERIKPANPKWEKEPSYIEEDKGELRGDYFTLAHLPNIREIQLERLPLFTAISRLEKPEKLEPKIPKSYISKRKRNVGIKIGLINEL